MSAACIGVILLGFVCLGCGTERTTDRFRAEPAKARRSTPEPLYRLAVAPHGRSMAVIGRVGPIRLLDARGEDELGCLEWESVQAVAVVYHPHDGSLLAGYDDGSIVRWVADSECGPYRPVRLGRHATRVNDCGISADGEVAATCDSSRELTIWRKLNPKPAVKIRVSSTVHSLDFSADGRRLYTAHFDGHVRTWSTTNGDLIADRLEHNGTLRTLDVSPDGRYLAVGGPAGKINVWNLRENKIEFTITAGVMPVKHVRFSPDSTRLATVAVARCIHVWELQDCRLLRVLKGHADVVSAFEFAPDGESLISVGCDGRITRHDLNAAVDGFRKSTGR